MSEILETAISRFAHFAAALASKKGLRQFKRALRNPEQVQRARLQRIIQTVEGMDAANKYGLTADMTWEAYSQSVPVTDYSDWSQSIEMQRSGHGNLLSNSVCQRYQPTSGSTSKVKWIPYTDAFLTELDNAVSPMMADKYKTHPGISKGKHYWSFSWVPTELRSTISGDINNDLNLLPWWKRLFMSMSKAVPDSVSLADTSDDSMYATLCFLLKDRELTFLSVWSPTFALTLLDGLAIHRKELSQSLERGDWGKRSTSLGALKCPKSILVASWLKEWDGVLTTDFIRNIWPKMALISAWDTSTSAIWAKQLKSLFPHAQFQGKGLWATEGVVTIPYQGKYPLALNSHFYEFMDIKTGVVYPSWGLHIGQEVRPILTTGSGLLRYGMKDNMRVVDFIQRCPCFEFLGRMDGADMVGEKLSADVATDLIKTFSAPCNNVDIRPLSLLAVPNQGVGVEGREDCKPMYLLLCEIDKNIDMTLVNKMQCHLAAAVEAELQKHFHYKLARDLGQLNHAEVCCVENARALYLERGSQRGMVTGNIKVEPLVLWDCEFPIEFESNAASQTLCETNKHEAMSVKEVLSHGC